MFRLNVNDKFIELEDAFVPKENTLTFRISNFLPGEELSFDFKMNALIFNYKGKKAVIRVNFLNNSDTITKMYELYKKLNDEIRQYNDRLKSGEETILAIGSEECADDEGYIIMTDSQMKDSSRSPRFIKGLLYYVNKKLGGRIKNFIELQSAINKALNTKDLSQYMKEKNDNEVTIKIPFKDILESL